MSQSRRLAVLALLALAGHTAAAQTPAAVLAAPKPADDILLQMREAYGKGDQATLSRLLPRARGHALEPWAAYWELKARLDNAAPGEIRAFLTRWRGTYQEDRLRNDWLLLLGQRRDWAQFAGAYQDFRMRDDRSVQCHALMLPQQPDGARVSREAIEKIRALWMQGSTPAPGCAQAVRDLYAQGRFAALDIWRRARLASEANRQTVVRDAVALVAPKLAGQVKQIFSAPAKYLAARQRAPKEQVSGDMVLLALLRLAAREGPDKAAARLQGHWADKLTKEQLDWAWAGLGQQAARRLQPKALDYFARVGKDAAWSAWGGDALAWRARAALRAGNWAQVLSSIAAMPEGEQQDTAWQYWKARALLALAPARAQDDQAGEAAQAAPGPAQQAQKIFRGIAHWGDFYGQLALEALGQPIRLPPAPPPLSAAEKAAARANPGLLRALYAIHIGLRSEGVREWNYTTNLHQRGGMGERELLAAADLACQHQVLDRCINTSERTTALADWRQRYPTPFLEQVQARTRAIGLDAAYVYGLIRQESRFIMDARSHAGASGLMQLMPATARWTAKKIGMEGFTPERVNERDVNIELGTAYLKLALDDLDGSLVLAAAAYNAGPGRARTWRNGPTLEAAIWAENVPFAETRDYVKKVLANTTIYAMLLGGQPQSLRQRLGRVGPKPASAAPPDADLPYGV